MPNPYYDAQEMVAEDPSQAQGLAEGVPSYPAEEQPMSIGPDGAPQAGPSVSQIGELRDSLLSQFPDLMAPDEPESPMTFGQRMDWLGFAMANPTGALDLIRQKRDQKLRRQELRAEMAMRMTGVAADILKTQGDSEKALLEAHLRMNEERRKWRELEVNEQLGRGELGVRQANAALEAQRYRDQQEMQQQILGGASVGYDEGGNPISTPGGGTMGGLRRSMTLGPGGASLTLSDPSTQATRDPRVDFDSWVRARFPRGVPSRVTTAELVAQYRRERSMLMPGSFGDLAAPGLDGQNIFRPSEDASGYDDLSSEVP